MAIDDAAKAVKTVIVKGLGKIRFPASMADDEIAGIIKRHADLDMSEPARMARAKAAGFSLGEMKKTDWPSAKIDVHFSDEMPRGAFVDANGQTRLVLPTAFKNDPDYIQNRTFRDIDEMLSPLKDDEYIRVSDSAADSKHIKAKTHQGSKNWSTNETEGGLSVAKSPEFGAKYEYIVSGKKIGTGSDSEPLLDVNSVKINRRLDRKKYNDDMIAAAKEKYGLTEEDIRILRSSREYNKKAGDMPSGTRSRNAAFNPELKFSDNILASAAPAALGLAALLSLASPESQANEQRAINRLAELGQSRPTSTIQAAQHPLLGRAANALLSFETPIDPLTGKQFQNTANLLQKFNYGDPRSYWDYFNANLDWM